MPPKKKTGADASGSPTKFSWTPENDRTLLLLCFGRNTSPADYHNFIFALPAGANFQGVRQRISKLRVEQRALYQEHGWELTTEAGVRKAKEGGKVGGKRKGRESEEEGGEGEERERETVKRGKKAKGEEVVEESGKEEGVKGEGGEEEI